MITFKDANKLSIRKYLETLDIYPVNDRGYYGLYYSPFRQDDNASMKVDYNKNLWIDYGTNDGGTLTDLVMRINNCSNKEAIEIVEKQFFNSFSFHGNNNEIVRAQSKQAPSISIEKVIGLTNPALLKYLNERFINNDIAKTHCKEIHYNVNDRTYFAIGFPNNTGGYELRSTYFKGCTSKDITSYNTNNNSCFVFEGFIDFLSYLTLKKINQLPADILILNSISNISKGLEYLKAHKEIYTFLDNDEGGRNTTRTIESSCKSVYNLSPKYSEYKDVNDLLCRKKLADSKQSNLQERKHPFKDASKQENKQTSNQIPLRKKPGKRMKF